MKTARLSGILTILLFVTLSVSLVSAVIVTPQTIVVGKIYDQTYGASGLGDVAIEIVCGTTGSWTGTSQSNGDYGANFNTSDCNDNNTMNVTLSNKPGYKIHIFNSNGTISTIPQGDDSLLIVNFVMTLVTPPPVNTGGGGGGGGGCTPSFWDCPVEWSECINGNQTQTCRSNCGTSKIETQSCSAPTLELMSEGISETEEQTPTGGFFSTITGAVTGTLGTGGTILAFIFIIVTLGAFTFTKFKKKE